MGPDDSGLGVYTDWKTLEFEFAWSLGAGAVSISASRLVAVPEPSSLSLCGFAVLLMAGVGHRRIRRPKKQG